MYSRETKLCTIIFNSKQLADNTLPNFANMAVTTMCHIFNCLPVLSYKFGKICQNYVYWQSL